MPVIGYTKNLYRIGKHTEHIKIEMAFSEVSRMGGLHLRDAVTIELLRPEWGDQPAKEKAIALLHSALRDLQDWPGR